MLQMFLQKVVSLWPWNYVSNVKRSWVFRVFWGIILPQFYRDLILNQYKDPFLTNQYNAKLGGGLVVSNIFIFTPTWENDPT